MARTAVQEPAQASESVSASDFGASNDVEKSEVTAVGYDANGEAVDVPVDTRVEPPLPGFDDELPEAE